MTALKKLKQKIDQEEISGKDIILFAESLVDIAENSEDIQELLEDMADEEENVILNMNLTDMDGIAAVLSIIDGEISAKGELHESPDLTIEMTEDTAIEILYGRQNIQGAYGAGKIKAKGNFAKVLGLALILEELSDELNIA